MNIQESTNEFKAAHKINARLSGAKRRWVGGSIVDALRVFGAITRVASVEIPDVETRFAGVRGWEKHMSGHRGFLAHREDTRENFTDAHSWHGTEVWVVERGLLEATISGSYNGLQRAGDVVESERRTFAPIGVREVTRRYGLEFVRSLTNRVAEAASALDKSNAEIEVELVRVARVRSALTT